MKSIRSHTRCCPAALLRCPLRLVAGRAALLAGFFVASLFGFPKAYAQDALPPASKRIAADAFSVSAPGAIHPEQQAQLFVNVPARTYNGVRFNLPSGFVVISSAVESFQSGPVRHSLRLSDSGNSGEVLFDSPVSSRCVIMLKFRAGETVLEGAVSVAPVLRSYGISNVDGSSEVVRRVAVNPSAQTLNRVLTLSRDRRLLEFEQRSLRNMEQSAPFTIAAWVRTTDIGGIILSSWTGIEDDSYPFELLVGVDGTAVFYRGKSGEHQSMRSRTPIADGTWHHVAISSDPGSSRAVLYVDGQQTDSLLTAFTITGKGLRMVAGGRVPASVRRGAGMTGALDGAVDDVGLWMQALPASAVARLADGATTALPRPVVLQEFTDEDLQLGRLPERVELAAEQVIAPKSVVELTGRLSAGTVELTWNSTSPDASAFAVQRSEDGIIFETIGAVPRVGGQEEYSYRDAFIDARVLYYRVKREGTDGEAHLSPVIKLGVADPMETTDGLLKGNAPNPFSEGTSINYEIPEAGHVNISVWDLSGQPVRTLVDAQQSAGVYEVQFVAGDLSAGTYFVRLRYDNRLESAKILLVK